MTKFAVSGAALCSTFLLAASAYAQPGSSATDAAAPPKSGAAARTQSSAAFEDVPEPAPPAVVAPAPPADPCPPPNTLPPVSQITPLPAAYAPPASDPDAVFRAFSVYAGQEKRQRIAGAIGGVAVGAATIAVGAVIADQTTTDPTFWYVFGGATAGASVLGLLFPSKAEGIVNAVGADTTGHTAEQAATMERKWRELAADAKKARMVSAVVGGVLGAGAIVVGAVLVSNAAPNSDDDLWGALLIGGGAGAVLSVPLVLIMPSQVESAYAQYEATKPVAPTLQLSVNGPGLSLSGSF